MRKDSRIWRLVACALVVCLLLSCIPLAATAKQSLTLQEVPTADQELALNHAETEQSDAPAADENLRVIIIFQEQPVVLQGYSTRGLAGNAEAMARRDQLKTSQIKAMAAVNRALGEKLEVTYQFTLGVNGVATTVRYEQIAEIEALPQVKKVYIENQYLPDVESPDTSTSGTMVGSYSAWAAGYTGAGSRIAIIDTGIDLDHPSFDASCFRYGLELAAARAGKNVADYQLLTADEIAKVLPELHAAELYEGLTAQELYRNEKVPFGFNYVDENLEITHDRDAQGDHGTHVSGIATANTYVWAKDADGDLAALRQKNGVVGIAPDAQLLTMKVFGAAGGAYDSDYMAAIEDAILLDCDSVNLSLGSSNPGHTYSDYDKLFASLAECDTVVTISAGNKFSYAEYNTTGTKLNLTGDTVIDTVGSPGAFGNAFTVASVDNMGLTGVMPVFNGVAAAYSDTYTDYKMNAFVTLDTSADKSGTSYPYVFLGDPVKGEHVYGAEEDFAGLDATGKIVLISRGGGVSFFEKANHAVEAGAAGVAVYNNASGTINMNLTGYNYKNPAVSIDKIYGEMILAASTQDEKGFWGGTMVIANQVQTITNVPGGYVPSDFSSWGVPGNLDLKPEIIAPGGNIWSTMDNGTYGSMSGTSMAAPSVTGMAAVVAQYIRENGLDKKEGMTVRALAQALLMSTASPLKQDDGAEYSPRKQGAGLADVYAAVTSPAYLLTNSTDGKAKAVLGDDPERKGLYEFDFTVNNLSDEAVHYAFRAGMNTMAVEKIDGVDYMSNQARSLAPELAFTTDAPVLYLYDLNGDSVVDVKDAEALLAVANEASAKPLSEQEKERCDFDGDGRITTKDVKVFMTSLKGDRTVADVTAKTYVVEPGKSIQVHASIRLSKADRDYFAENYANGCYVEGFVYAEDPDGLNCPLSLPVLAYYGAWTEPSMFDKFIALEDYGDETAASYVGVPYANALIMNNSYYLTANPYVDGSSYLADRTSLSSSTSISAAVATLIRNAGGTMYAEISNAETGEVYKTVEKGAQYGAFYNATSAVWTNTGISTALNWKPVDAEGNALPEGTKVRVAVYAIPEYNWNREKGEPTGTLSHGACWETVLTVDNTAPQILDATYSRNLITGNAELNVTAQDDRYVAAVLVANARQTMVLARGGAEQTELGVPTAVSVDISEINASEVTLLVLDYAGNTRAYSVKLEGSEDDGDVTEYIYANDTSDNSWLAFKPDDVSNASVVANGDIYAAEYIDGYVFTVDSNRRFCVAPLEDLETQTYIETLKTTSNVLDLAYNYADGKLYALCTDNYIYTVDPLMGKTEQVGVVPLPAGNTLQTLACSTEGTFYGVSNNQFSSKLYSFTVDAEGFHVTTLSTGTGYSTVYIQSMTYDHNTGKLYHANFGFTPDGSNFQSKLLTYDLKTGKATELGDFGRSELCGLFVPRKTVNMFGPSNDVQEISLSQTEITMLQGGKATLEVSAKPWTVVNRECTWATTDEKVATVENGVITAVGAGTCTIAAASVLNPQAVATCTVTVSALDKTLNGVVWDTDSKPWFASFKTSELPGFTKLSGEAAAENILSLAEADGVTYAATQNESADNVLTSTLYTVSADYTLTKIGASEIGYTDMTWCPKMNGGALLGTYGGNVAMIDTKTGGYTGAWSLEKYIGSADAVGITYVTTQTADDSQIDVCLLLDSLGNVWQVGFTMQEADPVITVPQKLVNLGYTTEGNWYFSSIATDGAYLYCSIFNGTQSDIVVLDLNTGAIANVGNFGTEVWPVVGLTVPVTKQPSENGLLVQSAETAAMLAPVPAQTEAVAALRAEA